MKYDKNRKIQRDELVLKYRREFPEYSLEEIGLFFCITRQRVSQILKKFRDKEAVK